MKENLVWCAPHAISVMLNAVAYYCAQTTKSQISYESVCERERREKKETEKEK